MDIIMFLGCTIIFLVCVVSLVGIVVWLIYEASKSIYNRKLRYEIESITAIVHKKEYKEPYSTTFIMPVGKVMVPHSQYHPEEYNVYLLYLGEKHCCNSKQLYEKVEVNDVVSISVHRGYNNLNEFKNMYITIN